MNASGMEAVLLGCMNSTRLLKIIDATHIHGIWRVIENIILQRLLMKFDFARNS